MDVELWELVPISDGILLKADTHTDTHMYTHTHTHTHTHTDRQT